MVRGFCIMSNYFRKIYFFIILISTSFVISFIISIPNLNNIINIKSELNEIKILKDNKIKFINENNKFNSDINLLSVKLYKLEEFENNKNVLIDEINNNKEELIKMKSKIQKLEEKIKNKEKAIQEIKEYVNE